MKQLFHTFLLCGSLLALASCGTDDLLPVPDAGGNTPGEPGARPQVSIIATMGAASAADTRTGYDDTPNAGIKVRWAEDDQFAIHSLDAEGKRAGSTTFILVKGDAGKESAAFTGALPVKGEKYLICYPAHVAVASDGSGSSLSMLGQKQTGNNSIAHLSKFDPMLGHQMKEGDFSKDSPMEISFTPDATTHIESGHRAALMTFNLTNIPDDLGVPERIVLNTNQGDTFYSDATVTGSPAMTKIPALTLELEKVSAGGQRIVAYMMMAPTTISAGDKLTITLEGSLNTYTFTSPEFANDMSYIRGMRYNANVSTWTKAIIEYTGAATVSSRYTRASGEYSRGSGTEADPYHISTPNDLEKLITDVNTGVPSDGKYFKLTRDVTIAMAPGRSWTAIGSSSYHFKGIFDGNGHTIGGIMAASSSLGGFFGYIDFATIDNLTIDAIVSSTGQVGGIAAIAYNSTISNCTNKGKVTGTEEYDNGGIAGTCSNTTIINCANQGEVSVGMYCGGIVGMGGNATNIIACYNTAPVTVSSAKVFAGGTASGGGIAGRMVDSPITLCYNTGKIGQTGTIGLLGTIVGSSNSSSNDRITDCRYVPAEGNEALSVCGGALGVDTGNASLTDLSALNSAGVTDLNAGIKTWRTSNPKETCYYFKSVGNDAAPVFAFPSGSIGGLGDGGNAVN